ncbi:hypothetical protein [Nocardia testacea]|uniref:hypothetical protein n=1 Tax=Nocardia testacea TaxID=248551 RepID=UPI0002DABB6B|nr:hypothetical protein [Nocardia testacea]
MNPNPAQRTRRLAARIAAIAVIALAPLAGTAGTALADPGQASQISDSHDSGDSFGDSDSWNGNGDFGWDDNGQYGYVDHNQQNYDGYEDHLNSGGNQYPDRDSHNDAGYDQPADWDRTDHGGGTQSPAVWNTPNPYIPAPAPSLLPAVHLPLPQLPFALPGLPRLP